MTYDAIVIGVGGMGSATLYHLARRGLRVLGIERFDVPHELGSSHGESRIIRLAYAEHPDYVPQGVRPPQQWDVIRMLGVREPDDAAFAVRRAEHPDYVPLLRRSYALWRELEDLAGEKLLIVTGGIDAGVDDSATVRGSLASCALHDLPHERLDAQALTQRFPGYRLSRDMLAVYQPDAGFLLPERCVVAHVNAARALGAEVHTRERVLRWDDVGGEVDVETDQGSYRARKLLIAAGPWARTLVPALDRLAIPERQVMLWTAPRVPSYFECGAFPVFNMEAPEGRFYGFPVHGIPGFKIGKYNHRRERIDDVDAMDRECHAADEAVLREGIRRYFPDADGPALAMKACIFTNSPDEHFILDVPAAHPV